jgi:hypothetical protein
MKKIKNKEMEKGIKNIMETIIQKAKEEDKESPIYDFIATKKEYLSNPDTFNTMVVYRIKRIIHTFIETQFTEKNYLAQAIYMDYDFFKNNISQLCSKLYGSGCCVDRARFLLKSAIKYKEMGELPKFDWKAEYTFHYPKTATPKMWIEFIEGLYGLRYGNNEKYLIALNNIIKDYEKSKYKEKMKK